jgi:hypothetical protein
MRAQEASDENRSAMDGYPRTEPDAALVHVQLAGELARGLVRRADIPTVKNLINQNVTLEGRYAIMNV